MTSPTPSNGLIVPRATNILVPTEGDVISANEWGIPISNQVNTNTGQIASNTTGVTNNTNRLTQLDAGWQSFTPTINTGNPGAGPVFGLYKVTAAKVLEVIFNWQWGSGAAGGSGNYTWIFPGAFTSPSYPDYCVVGSAHVAFQSTARAICTVHKVGNSVCIFGTFGQLGASVPQGVLVGDTYYVSYRVPIA
jgi:hypothetical protein